jgi:hypothetical protein
MRRSPVTPRATPCSSTSPVTPRLPYVELGEAAFVTGFVGTYEPQPPPTIEDLGFSSHADYLAAFEDALDDQVDAGYMLDEDAQAILGRAALSPPATFTENYFARYQQFAAGEYCPLSSPWALTVTSAPPAVGE